MSEVDKRTGAVPGNEIRNDMFIIKINGCDNCLVNKRETYKNLSAVNKGRKWAGYWYGQVLSKGCLFATREEAEKEVARLSQLKNLGNAFNCNEFTYVIEKVNK